MSEEPETTERPAEEANLPPAALRARLVDALIADGALHDAAVERAMDTVPRHLFVPDLPLAQAYVNDAIPTHWEDGVPVSSASQPAIVAIMLEQLRLQPGMRALEIGAGTGYNAALLAELVGPTGRVTTMDIDGEIAAEARAHLASAHYERVRVVTADGFAGWPADAPYDRIELTVGVSDVSPAWFAQLAEGGVLLLPLWLGTSDVSVALRKRGDLLLSESLAPCGFMRLRGPERDDRQWVSLNGKWHLGAEHAERIADAVAALLATRPRIRPWVPPSPAIFQFLGLRGLQVVSLVADAKPNDKPNAKRRARVTQRRGVYAEGPDGPSLSLLAARMPLLFTFGGAAAERALEAETATWQRARMLPLDRWRITARPLAAAIAVPPPAGAVRLARRHFAFDIELDPDPEEPLP